LWFAAMELQAMHHTALEIPTTCRSAYRRRARLCRALAPR
jgi:hypothetical protein